VTPQREQADARPLRLFVAVELSDDVRRALDDAIAVLKRAGADDGLRWVRPDGIHLTLKFLGATPPDRVSAIVSALREHLRGATAFDLQPDGFGAFHGGKHVVSRREWQREPRHHNVRVVWVGVEGETAKLAGLASRVEAALSPLGFPAENRPFSAHLTLARARDDSGRETRERLYKALDPYLSKSTRSGNFRQELVPRFPPFRVDHVSLMQSMLRPGGAVYRAVETFALDSKQRQIP
jgi:2'-5' RNA ligase